MYDEKSGMNLIFLSLFLTNSNPPHFRYIIHNPIFHFQLILFYFTLFHSLTYTFTLFNTSIILFNNYKLCTYYISCCVSISCDMHTTVHTSVHKFVMMMSSSCGSKLLCCVRPVCLCVFFIDSQLIEQLKMESQNLRIFLMNALPICWKKT